MTRGKRDPPTARAQRGGGGGAATPGVRCVGGAPRPMRVLGLLGVGGGGSPHLGACWLGLSRVLLLGWGGGACRPFPAPRLSDAAGSERGTMRESWVR